MTDHDALLRAICAAPEDDTPRLIFADFLEEAGDPARAAFVRAQVDLARTPPWEPFAVFCRHRKPEWATGDPWRHTLPLADGVEWHPRAFRRGLGWRAVVRDLFSWHAAAPRLFDLAPVGELRLSPPATRDDWRGFASAAWVRFLRVVHLEGGSPVEPTRALCESPHTTGITDLHYRRASSAGLPILVEDLWPTPLGRAVRGLHFRMGYEALEFVIEALAAGGVGRLDRLSFAVMGLTAEHVRPLRDGGVLSGLTELSLTAEPLGPEGLGELAAGLPAGLHTLGLVDTGFRSAGLAALARSPAGGLRRLDLSRNPLRPRATGVLSRLDTLSGLRSLGLQRCRVGDTGVRQLTRATFWPNLVELDLRGNPISDAGGRHLLGAAVPPDLTALLLDADGFGDRMRAELRRQLGERVVFSTESG